MARVTVDQIYELDAGLIADAIKLRFYPFAAESGEGCRLRDVEGKEYLDFTAGWALANTGYSHPHVKQAVIEQLNRTTFAGLVSGMHEPALRLAEKLVELVPGDFRKKAWFGLCGSDASETVGRLLPLATGKRRMVSFIGAYHGSTAASMAMSAHVAQTQFIGGGHVVKVPYPNPYRCPFGDDVGDCAERAIRFLEDYIFKTICPPGDVAGVIVEAVQSDCQVCWKIGAGGVQHLPGDQTGIGRRSLARRCRNSGFSATSAFRHTSIGKTSFAGACWPGKTPAKRQRGSCNSASSVSRTVSRYAATS